MAAAVGARLVLDSRVGQRGKLKVAVASEVGEENNFLVCLWVAELEGLSDPSELVLHWGLTCEGETAWVVPDKSLWPSANPTVAVRGAVQSRFIAANAASQSVSNILAAAGVDDARAGGAAVVSLKFKLPDGAGRGRACRPGDMKGMVFVLHKTPNAWYKQDNKADFRVELLDIAEEISAGREIETSAARRCEELHHGAKPSCKKTWSISHNGRAVAVYAFVYTDAIDVTIDIFTDNSHPVALHWGFAVDPTAPTDIVAAAAAVNAGRSRWVWSQPDVRTLKVDVAQFVTHPWSNNALQTQLAFLSKSGETAIQYLSFGFDGAHAPHAVCFVLKEINASRWIKDSSVGNRQGGDFMLVMPRREEWNPRRLVHLEAKAAEEQAREESAQQSASLWKAAKTRFEKTRAARQIPPPATFRNFKLSDDVGELDVSIFPSDEKDALMVVLTACLREPCLLHWGVVGKTGERRIAETDWRCPPASYQPDGSFPVDLKRACQSTFNLKDPAVPMIYELQLRIPAHSSPVTDTNHPGVTPEVGGIACVLKEANGARWFKTADQKDILIRLVTDHATRWRGDLAELVAQILEAEIEWQHMTLMHRYNLVNTAITKWDESRSEFDRRSSFAFARLKSWSNILEPNPPIRSFSSVSSDAASAAAAAARERDQDFWTWIYVWCRFSYLGLLDWQRNYNTKPRELAGATEAVTKKVTSLWLASPEWRYWIRLCLSTMSRGGNQGQAIRDKILDIMHKHRIPEHGQNFYEQWHQKLHNNTTPDDVSICRALIKYLKSNGDMSQYWKTLQDARITQERLASYERKVTSEPYMPPCNIPELIRDFEGYLDILQDVHDALDLKKAFGHARRYLPAGMETSLSAVVDALVAQRSSAGPGGLGQRRHSFHGRQVNEFNSHKRFLSIAELRKRLLFELNRSEISVDAARELLFLDFALEQQQGLIVQAEAEFATHHIVDMLREALVCLSGHDPVNAELKCLAADWNNLANRCAYSQFGESAVESATMLKSLIDRVARAIGDVVDSTNRLLFPKSQFLGSQVGVDKKILNVFVDEVLRGSALMTLSVFTRMIEPHIRAAAQLPPWQLISLQPKVQGELQKIDRLLHIQDKVFSKPTILLSGRVSGEEEIPTGVQAVLVRSAAESPDILSHVSVRARNANVLLAVCFEPEIAEHLENEFVGKWVEITCPPNGLLQVTALDPPPDIGHETGISRTLTSLFDRSQTQEELIHDRPLRGSKATKAEMNLTQVSAEWCITPDKFSRATVGSKSLNLAELRPKLPADVVCPPCVALPYGCFQKAVTAPANSRVFTALQEVLKQLQPDTPNPEAAKIFEQVQRMILSIRMPDELKTALQAALETEETQPVEGASMIQLYDKWGHFPAWKAICGVWASLFGLRPWVSLSKSGRSYHELNMAVLVQSLLPASYAFVLHSKNPFASPDSTIQDEMYGEMVFGLGETLVGNYPGRALSWRMQRGGQPRVIAFPNKSAALRGEACLIFRSDSNGEDLDGFAGAGLFESITAETPRLVQLRYSTLRLIQDTEYRTELLKKIGELAFLIEDHFGVAMDIEGVVIGDHRLGVVQARPQV